MSEPEEPPFPTLAEVVDRHVLEAVARCGGHKGRAAALLGISSKTVYNRLAAIEAAREHRERMAR